MGKIELDHTGSGGGVTLSSDGTDLLLDGTAIGGGGGSPDLYAANDVSATAPSATGDNSVAIGPSSEANSDNATAFGYRSEAKASKAVAIGEGRAGGASATAISIGTTSTAYGATGVNSIAIGYQAKATGTYSTALSQNSVATGQDGFAIGKGLASGNYSLAAVIANNSTSYGASGANSVAIGYRAKATASGAMAFGDRNTASAEDAVVFGESNTGSGAFSFTAGRSNTNSGSRGVALGNSHTVSSFYTFASGSQNTASQSYAHAVGSKSLADRQGKFAHASLGFGTVGDSQYGRMVLSKATTDATPTVLTAIQNNAASSANMPVIPSGGAQAFSGLLVAKQTGSANAAAWEIKGLIVNNGGTTTLVNSAITVIDNTPSWGGPVVTADDTNDWLAITCTGAASTSIRWSLTLNTSEVIYA
jgi:hypothetical protein